MAMATAQKNEFLTKAKENLRAAQICFENGLYNACANRFYYAALQRFVIKESEETKLTTGRYRQISAAS